METTFTPYGNIHGPILPTFVLSRRITFGAKIMYAVLCNYASYYKADCCWPSHAKLADTLSCSVSSVKNYLGELVRARLIVVRRKQYRSCVYYLLNPEELRDNQAQASQRQTSPHQPTPDCVQPKAAYAQPKVGYLNTRRKQREEKNPPLPPRKPEPAKVSSFPKAPAAGGVSSLASDFEIAFALYPKQEARAYAWMAWHKLAGNGHLPPLDVILASIRRFAASESWQRDNGRFVPQMSNWLRGQRWLDPLSPAEERERREQQRREEHNRAIQAQEERERRLQEQKNAEKARLRPLYEAFAASFPEQLNEAKAAMAFGTWLHLQSQGLAPLAFDVPADNALDIIEFLNAFKRHRNEARYRASHEQPEQYRLAARANGPRPCAEILRHLPVFSRDFSRTEQLRRAV